MDSRDRRAKEIQQGIRNVLLQDWDPIHVRYEPQAQDEYDSYLGGVYRLLASGAAPPALTEPLARIEREEMGFQTSAAQLMDVATKLSNLHVQVGPSNGAA